jgi:CRP/FNR family transcriptional regulator, cyclic AMP receptor protein
VNGVPSTDLTTVGVKGQLLDGLAPADRTRLLDATTSWVARSGEPIFPPTAAWTRTGLIESGIARAYLASLDGRQLTVRYVREGDTIGSMFPIAGDRAPLGIGAVTECRILEFDARTLLDIIESDATAARHLLSLFSRRLEDLYATLAAMAFGSMRERLAGHLLELAQVEPATGALVAPITQQQLADGVGTVREVVARGLRDLRDEGLVATTPGRIEILDATRLAASVGRWRSAGR